jgi:NodT family efflux transporter outer membrane factor (OMF) lipoprotein
MNKYITYTSLLLVLICFSFSRCKLPQLEHTPDLELLPKVYPKSLDSINSAASNWKTFIKDTYLQSLIEIALERNLDVKSTLQDIAIAKNQFSFKKSLLSPNLHFVGSTGIEKVGRYTSQGAGDASAEITPGNLVPEKLSDFLTGFRASWELDIWGKLNSSKKAAYAHYLSTIEARNFAKTNLIAEVANNYYELLALDNQLDIIRQTIQLQKNQLEIVKVQKLASVVTELAVKQFEAQVLNSESMEVELLQKITVIENEINFLLGRYPQVIAREKSPLVLLPLYIAKVGVPSQLLKNRPDVQQAELEMLAAKCELRASKLEFYPSINLSSSLGAQAFKTSLLYTFPASLLYNAVSEITAPVLNRKAIVAAYKTANAQQIKAIYDYQKALLNGYLEVSNQLAIIENLERIYDLRNKEVVVLSKSIEIATDLFKSARANYLEVLTAQRDALSTKFELIDAKKQQFQSLINIYRSLGGGWK